MTDQYWVQWHFSKKKFFFECWGSWPSAVQRMGKGNRSSHVWGVTIREDHTICSVTAKNLLKNKSSQVLCYHQKLTSQRGSQSCLWKCFKNEAQHSANHGWESVRALWKSQSWGFLLELSTSREGVPNISVSIYVFRCTHQRHKASLQVRTHGECRG